MTLVDGQVLPLAGFDGNAELDFARSGPRTDTVDWNENVSYGAAL